MQLSEHFTLAELTYSETAMRRGIDNLPGDVELGNLRQTAARMEAVRAILGHPLTISSGYRCIALNRQIGSKDTSAHVRGQAVDFTCPAFGTPLEVARELAKHAAVLQFDQIILEYRRWVHAGWITGRPRGELLTIDTSGTRTGLA